jgi:hypothetical protein
MSKADSIKERLALIRFGLTAFSGLLFVVFWGLTQNEYFVKSISETMRWRLVTVVIALFVVLLYLLIDYGRKLSLLEKEP